MSNLEYQDKIISLLDELTRVFSNIGYTLNDLIIQSLKIKNLKESEIKNLKETKIEELRKTLSEKINSAWDIIDRLSNSIQSNEKFTDVDAISGEVLRLVSSIKFANGEYNSAKKEGLLDEGLIQNKKSLLDALKDISDYIIEYNKKFDPKLKTLKWLLKENEVTNRENAKQFYEEIFGRN